MKKISLPHIKKNDSGKSKGVIESLRRLAQLFGFFPLFRRENALVDHPFVQLFARALDLGKQCAVRNIGHFTAQKDVIISASFGDLVSDRDRPRLIPRKIGVFARVGIPERTEHKGEVHIGRDNRIGIEKGIRNALCQPVFISIRNISVPYSKYIGRSISQSEPLTNSYFSDNSFFIFSNP